MKAKPAIISARRSMLILVLVAGSALAQSAPVGAAATVVEYYNASLDHYFITPLATERANLDAGLTPTRWTRTGKSFYTFESAGIGTSPVCRFYIPPALGDSHFFGRGPAECDSTAVRNPSFVLEAPAFMHMVLPTAGMCPSGTEPVYRVFSNRADANHRYTTDKATRDQMVEKGWLPEGDGPDLVVMCAPATFSLPSSPYPLLATPPGSACTHVVNYDALGEVVFEVFVDPIPHGCMVVDSSNQQPVLDGVQSVRFELRPGECNASPASPDCVNDRARYEISEIGVASTEGKLVIYDLWVYVPPQPRFRPRGDNILVLNQIQYLHPNKLGGVLAYLEVGATGELVVRTHAGFSFDMPKLYIVAGNPTGRWTKVRWEIGSTAQADGFLRVYVDDALKVNETRPTLQAADMHHALKFGIYNGGLSRAVEPYETQVVYFDGIRRTVK